MVAPASGWTARIGLSLLVSSLACSFVVGCAGSDWTGKSAPVSESLAAPATDTSVGTATASAADSLQATGGVPAAGNSPKSAMSYARTLKRTGKLKEAYEVLESASAAAPGDRALLTERGLMALELGRMAEAQQLLKEASDGSTKDWRVLSGLGIASAGQGKQKEAQRYFMSALQASPDNPTVLNNLAVSYILDKKLEAAETTLRKASLAKSPERQPPQVAQNLALASAMRTDQPPSGEEQPSAASFGMSEPAPMGLTGGLNRGAGAQAAR